MINDVTFIIRSVDERTTSLCRQLILQQGINESNIFQVNEIPFTNALIKSLSLGLEQGLSWTYCIDADVLLRSGSIESMLRYASKAGSKVCEIQGLVIDKFFGGPRPAGNHLYRTSLLSKVISQIPKEGVDIRPEYHALLNMRKIGYKWYNVPFVIGLHDHEQYYKDIYRKTFVQGFKHLSNAELFLTIWKQKRNDKDFEVALNAFSDSILSSDKLHIDASQNTYKLGFEKLNVQEKMEIELSSYDINIIDKICMEWKEPAIYLRKYPTRWGLDGSYRSLAKLNRLIKDKERLRNKLTSLVTIK